MKKLFSGLTVFIMLLVLVACGGDSGFESSLKNFKNEDINYDGKSITWPSVDGNYNIKIDDYESEDILTNSYIYTTEEETFKVTLKISIEKKNFFSKAQSKTFERSFARLEDVTNIKFDNDSNTIKWDKVTNATSYTLELNGKENSKITDNSYKLDTNGDLKVRVKAFANNTTNLAYYSKYEESYEFHKLATPTNIKYDDSTGKISWSRVSKAQSYTVYIDSQPLEGFENLTNTSIDFDAKEKDFTIAVKANGDVENELFDSEISETSKYIFLDSVDNLSVKDGILTWNKTDGATGYELLINKSLVTTNTNSYDEFIPGRSYQVQVRAISSSGNFFSKFSSTIIVNIMEAPVTRYDNGLIVWEQINGADGYSVLITKDGNPLINETVDGGVGQYEHDYRDVGVYEVNIKANASSDSAFSDSKFSKTIKLTRLDRTVEPKITQDASYTSEARIELTNVPGAGCFDVKADNVSIERLSNNSLIFVFGPNNDTDTKDGLTIKIDITTLGKKINDFEYTLDSINKQSFEIEKLAIPQTNVYENKISWNAIANAKGYVIEVDGNIQYVEGNVTERQLTQSLTAGEHKVRVRAVSDRGFEKIISSDFGTTHTVYKLAAPSNVKIANGTLLWDQVDRSTAYEVRLGENAPFNAVQTTSYDLIDLVKTTAQTVQVKAKGNNQDVIESDYSANQTFYKLSAPEELNANNANIVFNQVAGAVSYQLKVGSNTFIRTSNSVPHGEIFKESGMYVMKVRAIGNNANIFDSDESESVTVTKLETPNIKVDKDGKTLVWDDNYPDFNFEIRVNTNKPFIQAENRYKPEFKEPGSYTIFVKHMGNDKNTITSAEAKFEFKAEALKQPEFSVQVSGNNVTLTVTNFSDYDAKTRWQYIAASNSSQVVDKETYTYENVGTGTVRYQVKAIGGYFGDTDGNNVMYVDKTSEMQEVTLLNPVRDGDITRSGNTINWKNTNTTVNVNYKIVVTYLDDNKNELGTEESLKQQETSYLMKNIPEGTKNIKVTITVIGNEENNIFDSKEISKEFSN